MSNHVHLVLHVDEDKAAQWSDKQMLALWHALYIAKLQTQKFMSYEGLSQGKLITLHKTIIRYRSRLHDISWFMRSLNEYITLEANKENDCTGRFYTQPSLVLILRPAEAVQNFFLEKFVGRVV